jgi:hypothetical protein
MLVSYPLLNWKMHGETLKKKFIKGSLFAHFQSLLQFVIIFWSSDTNPTKALMKQKRKVRVIFGIKTKDIWKTEI